MKVEEIRAKSPTLLLDAGNALFAQVNEDNEVARQKAELIVKTMGELKTAAMAVGVRDLNQGADWLKQRADKAKLTLLSANLTVDKKPVFEPSKVVTVGGLKVGLVGVTAPAAYPKFPNMISGQPVPAAIEEAKKLKGKVDLVVVLAAVHFPDALQLSRDGEGVIDLVLQSSEGRIGPMSATGQTLVVSGGQRGRQVVRVDLDLSGKGPLVDLGGLERQKQRVALLESQIVEAKRREKEALEPAVKQQFQQTVAAFEAQKAEAAKGIAPYLEKGKRTLAVLPFELGAEVASDPAIKAQVDKLPPPSH